MVETLKFFFNKETLISLQDHFDDSEKEGETLHRFIYEQLRELAKTSKLSDVNRAFNANIFDENGAMTQKSFKYSEHDIEQYKLVQNINWRPEDIQDEDLGEYEMKVGEKTHNHLLNYCKIHLARTKVLNESMPRKEDGKLDDRFKEIPVPECIEEILHQSLYQPIIQLLQRIAQDVFDKENEDIEKAEAEKSQK